MLLMIQWTKHQLELLGCRIRTHESVASSWDKCVMCTKNHSVSETIFSFLKWLAKTPISGTKYSPFDA